MSRGLKRYFGKIHFFMCRSYCKRISNYSLTIEQDKVLYVSKEKSQELFRVLTLQLGKGVNSLDFTNLGSDIVIHQSRNIVKPFVENISDNEQISEPEQSVSAPKAEKSGTVPPNEEALEEVIDDLTVTIRDKHIERLRRGECSPELGVYLSDLLINCERVSDHCSNIAISIIQIARSSMNYHVYINELKAQRSEQFMAAYNSYHEKYRLSA